jgi:hypothetical protein
VLNIDSKRKLRLKIKMNILKRKDISPFKKKAGINKRAKSVMKPPIPKANNVSRY